MKGLSLNEFINKIYYGDEVEFKIGNITYFVQGNYNGKEYQLTVDFWQKTDGTEPEHGYLFEVSCMTADERLKAFEDAAIFEGKTIYEVEDQICVLYA